MKVLLSSDTELKYAFELAGSPLRISIYTIGETQNTFNVDGAEQTLATGADYDQKNRGCGQKRGGRGNGRGRRVPRPGRSQNDNVEAGIQKRDCPLRKARGRGAAHAHYRAPKVERKPDFPHDETITAALVNFHTCKADMKEARKSGDPAAVESCKQAMRQARQLRREKMAALVGPQRAYYMQCVRKLKAAKKIGDVELEKEAHDELVVAINALKISKQNY